MDSQHFATFDASGRVLALFDAAASGKPPPPGAVALSSDQFNALWSGGQSVAFTSGIVIAVAPPPSLGAQLAALAMQKEVLGVWFRPAGAAAASLFPTDPASSVEISEVNAMANEGVWPANGFFDDINGVGVPVSAADVLALAKVIAAYVFGVKANARALGMQIKAGGTPDITQGWPSQGTGP